MHAIQNEIELTSLARTDLIFLWSIRVWYTSQPVVRTAWPRLEHVFTHERMRTALAPFNRFMAAVFSGLDCWPDIRCLHSPHLGRHEALLLTTLTNLQRGHEVTARRALKYWLQPSALRSVILHGAACANDQGVAELCFSCIPSCDPTHTTARIGNVIPIR